MSTLKKIVATAKKMKKSQPGRFDKWTDYIKAASKEINGYLGTKKKKKKSIGKPKKKKASITRHKDINSHNVKLTIMSGVKSKKLTTNDLKKYVAKRGKRLPHGYQLKNKVRKGIGEMPSYRDPIAAREIQLYADNDSQLYFQRRMPIVLNLQKKFKKGTYNVDKAAKLWKYYVDAAVQKYNKEFGSRGDKWFELLDMHDRKLLALEYAMDTLKDFEAGNFYE